MRTDRFINRLLWLTVLSLLCIGQTIAAPPVLLLNVQEAELAWADPHIYDRLERLLTGELGLQVVGTHHAAKLPAFPTNRSDTEGLVNWGQEAGGRYLMVVTIQSERLERRKSINVPLLFHKYETVGVVKGEVRLYDISRGRLLLSKDIDYKITAKNVFQASFDGDRNDPAIHLSAMEKLTFFGKLEDKVASKLTDRVKKVLRKS